MTRYSKFFIASFALLAMTVSASQAKADTWRHIQDLALDIQLKSDRLMSETHHYVHTPNYQRLIRSVSNMRQRAVRVHVLSIQHGCLDEMSRELRRLDNQFHAIEGLFDATEVESSHGHGHVHGNTRHVKKWLNCIEECIHHIRDDIAGLRPVAGLVYRNPLPPRNYGYGGGYGSCGSGGHGAGGYGAGGYGYAKPRKSGYHSAGYPHGSRGRGGISYQDRNFGISIGF